MFDAQLVPAPLPGRLATDQPTPPYTPRQAIGVRFGAFLGTMIVCLTLGLMASLGVGRQHKTAGLQILQCSLIVGSVVGYLLSERVLAGRRPLIELTWRRVRGLGWGLVAGVVAIVVLTALIALCGGYRIQGWGHPSLVVIGGTLLQAGLQAAVVEEIMFRGLLFRYVEVGLGSWGAIIVSAALFGLGHVFNPHANVVGTLGIVIEAGLLFAALYILTRSLWVVMGLHFSWNITQAALGIAVSGTRTEGLVRATPAGHDLISGGPFGLEASLVTVIVMGAVSGWLLVLAHRRGLFVAPLWSRRDNERKNHPNVPSPLT